MAITPEQLALSGSEDAHCIALMQWAALSGIKELKWLTHIPNGGARDKREGAKFKAMGVKRGIPDYILPLPVQTSFGEAWAGLWLEIKVGKNYPTDDQVAWHQYLNGVGYKCYVCYGWEEARDKLLAYINSYKV